MEVDVITRHAPANYGSLLQTIAIQKVLTNLGVDNTIIDYIPKEETEARIAFTQLMAKEAWNRSWLKRVIYIIGREPENLLMYHKFKKMRKKYLRMTPRFRTEQELMKFASESDAIFMTGSDQVWGPISSGVHKPAYFLEFVPDDKKKIAYAASFGKPTLPKEKIQEYKWLLKRYNYITVRENTAVELLLKMGISAEQVLDPALLITAEEWEKFIQKSDIPKEKYVLVYQIHRNPILDRYALEFSKRIGLPLIRVSPLMHQVIRGGKFVYLPDIGHFLALIKNASYLITDSFHGTAFAINFHVQFIEMLPGTGTESRNQSILKLMGLENRIVSDEKEFSYTNKMIDFTMVNQILVRERERSINILKRMLIL